MTGSTVILGGIFALAESAVEHGISGRWGVLGERISDEIKDVTVRIEVEVQLFFAIKGYILKVQAGQIKEVRTGTCDAEGVVQYAGQIIAERNLEPIQLPGSMTIHEHDSVEGHAVA